MSSLVSFSGLSSGLDTASIIEALVNVRRIPIERLEAEKSNNTAQQTVFSSIKTQLQDLESKSEAMDTPSEFFSYTATSSDEDTLTVAAGGAALPGSFSVQVNKLASVQRTYSDTYADDSTPVSASNRTLTIKVGSSASVDVAITNSMSLEDVASAINSTDEDVSASILYDGSNYRLQVAGIETGLANTITFSGDGATELGLDTPANTVQAAQDAEVVIDGFTITREDNTLNDVISGVTLDLKSVDASPVTVTIKADTAVIQKKVEDFISSYNTLQTTLSNQFRFNGEPDPRKPFGDSTLRGLQNGLRSLVTSSVSGLGGNYTALSNIGVTTQPDGTLKLDATDFKDALDADPIGVARVFAEDTDLGTSGIAKQLVDYADDYTGFTDGVLSQRVTGYDTRNSNLDDRIERLEDRVAAYEERISAEFVALEQLISSLQSQNSGLLSLSQSGAG